MFRSLLRPRVLAGIAAVAAIAAATAIWSARERVAPVVPYTLLDGRTASSADWPGKVVVVKFWATTCAVCLEQMPETIATHERYRAQGLDTVAVAMAYDPPARVAHYAQTRALPFGVAIDNTGAIARAFGDVQATPTTLVIDRTGRIVHRHEGRSDTAALRRLIESLLAPA